MPISADYADALLTEEIARTQAMIGLVPYPLKIGHLEGLAERCTSALKEGTSTLESLRRDVRTGGGVGAAMKVMSRCVTNISSVEGYGLAPLQGQTKEMAMLNVVLHGLHSELELPFPCPTACCISNRHYASHIQTSTIHVPIGESRSIQHFAHLYHELGHYLLRALGDPRLVPVREGLEIATVAVNEYYAGLAPDSEGGQGPMYTTNFIEWISAQWTEWLTEYFCDLLGVFGGGPASAWAYLHTVARKRLPVYGLGALVPQSHPPNDARMETMCAGLGLAGFGKDADSIRARWRDVVDTVGGSPGAMYRYMIPKDLMRNVTRIIYESLGKTSVVLYDPGSRGREGSSMRTLLNDAWDVFWRSREGEFQEWETAELDRLVRMAAQT